MLGSSRGVGCSQGGGGGGGGGRQLGNVSINKDKLAWLNGEAILEKEAVLEATAEACVPRSPVAANPLYPPTCASSPARSLWMTWRVLVHFVVDT